MAVTRRANSKAYDFKSIGTTFKKKAELDARNNPPAPPIGIATPVSLSEMGPNFLRMHTDFGSTLHDNLINLILTNHGERLALPDFGANLMELAFEMQSDEGSNEAMVRISTAVSRYMPYIILESFEPIIDYFENKEVAKVGVRVIYSIPRINVKSKGLEVIIFSAG